MSNKFCIFVPAKTIIKSRIIRFTYKFYSHINYGVAHPEIFKLRFLDCFRELRIATPIFSFNLKTI